MRKLLQQNSSVNLSGKQGKGIELDGFVEAEIVQPLKKYASGHTTVAMCQRLMANVDMLKLIRAAYVGKQGFDIHHSLRHSEHTSFPGALKRSMVLPTKRIFQERQTKRC